MKENITTFFQKIERSIEFSKTTHSEWDLYSSILKLDEEFGELAENVLILVGQLSHKQLGESSLGEAADNIIQTSCIVSYNDDISYYLRDIKNDYFINFPALINEIKSQNDFKKSIYYYHKKYRQARMSLISGIDVESLNSYKSSLYSIVILGILLNAIELKKDIKDFDLKFCEDSFDTLLERIEFKLNKWNNIHNKHIQG